MEIKQYNDCGKWKVIALFGKIDTISAPDFGRYVNNLIEGGLTHIALDFSKVDYINSSGLSVLITAFKQNSGNIVIINPNRIVMQVFEMSSFTRIFKIFQKTEDILSID